MTAPLGPATALNPAVALDPAAEHLISLRGVKKIYGTGESEVVALGGVDLDVARGDFVAIMGASGSGKSTCMNILGCLDRPTSGSFSLAGVSVNDLDLDGLTLLRRHYIGFVFQGFNLLARTSALENVELPLVYRRIGRAQRRASALEALSLVGLADRVEHNPQELSGGQQQRVAIARALVSQPELLLADEPTGNLDTTRTREVMELLVRLNRENNLTIIMVTHEPDVAEFAARTVVFRDGHILSDTRNQARPLGAAHGEVHG